MRREKKGGKRGEGTEGKGRDPRVGSHPPMFEILKGNACRYGIPSHFHP